MSLFKKSLFCTLLFSAAIMAGCGESDSNDKNKDKKDNPTSQQCTKQEDCASREDGKTKCDTDKKVCINPESENTTECTKQEDCASREDGKTKCDTDKKVCINPESENTTECTKQEDCASREDGKTKCDTDKKVCINPESENTTECTKQEDCASREDGKTKCDLDQNVCVKPASQQPSADCGNKTIDTGEECDSDNLNEKTCSSFNYKSGTLLCNSACEFDTSQCVECSEDTHCADKSDGKTKCSANKCVECSEDTHCADKPDGKTKCEANQCVKPGSVTPPNPSTNASVVISQIYPGGANGSSIYKSKYIELFNNGEGDADISNWSIQYGAANNTTIKTVCTIPAGKTIPKGGYFLIALKTSENGENDIITPDHSCSPEIAASATEGKLFLVANSTKLSSSSPDSGYVDAIGYGGANWAEGNAPVKALSNKTAAIRIQACTDTNNNANDFEILPQYAFSPKNSSSPKKVCFCQVEADCGDSMMTCDQNKCIPKDPSELSYEGGDGPNCPAGFITTNQNESESCVNYNSPEDIDESWEPTLDSTYPCIPDNLSYSFCRKVPKEDPSSLIIALDTQRCTAEQAKPGTDTLRVHFIDVGQGDAIWIQTPAGKNVLIDGGDNGVFGRTSGGPIVTDYLNTHGFKYGSTFDAVIMTIPYSDHFGGLNNIFNASNATHYKLVNYLDPMDLDTSLETLASSYIQWIDRVKSLITDQSHIYMPANGKFNPGNNLPADFFGEGVEAKYITSNNTFTNNYAEEAALIFKLTYKGVSFLFASDAAAAQEKAAIDTGIPLDANFLKVPHHGLSSSSSQNFLNAVWNNVDKQKRHAIISSGRRTYSGTHAPEESTVERLLAMIPVNNLLSTTAGDDSKSEKDAYRDDNILVVVKPDGSYYACYNGTN